MNNPEVYNSPKGKAPFLECDFFQFKNTPAKKTNFFISPEKTKENIKEITNENENIKIISNGLSENLKKKNVFEEKKSFEEQKLKTRSESCEKINILRKHRFSTVLIKKNQLEIQAKGLKKLPYMQTIDTLQSLGIDELKPQKMNEDCKGNRSEKLRSNLLGSSKECEQTNEYIYRKKSENLQTKINEF